jgi:hypothetical protein
MEMKKEVSLDNYYMKTKLITFLLALTFLFLFSGSSVVFGDDFQNGLDAINRGDNSTRVMVAISRTGEC